jgi:integrase
VSKTVRERKLDSPAARAKLKASGKPYWRAIDTGMHLGYRRGLHGGKWVLRRYLGDEKYTVETIGTADDHSAADGEGILDFFQAQRKARALTAQAKAPSRSGDFTVGDALATYFARLEHEGSKSLRGAKGTAARHILPKLGAVPVSALTRDTLAAWLTEMVTRAAEGNSSQDVTRAKRATANRVLTILRAALNQAFRDSKIGTDVGWRTVNPFKEVDAPRLRYFTTDEIHRLLNASQGAFRDLVKAALFTGCRYGELTRLKVGDFNRDAGTVFVGKSKSGKQRHVVLTDEGRRFFETMTAGRSGDALILANEGGSAWGASRQTRPMTEACKAAHITGASFHILRHTAASHLVMSGVPLNVVAHNLGHADTRMTEKHYAHLAPSYVAETIRKFAPDFGTGDDSNIISIRG